MDWIYRLQKKFGRYAVENLMVYFMILYGAGFLLMTVNPSFYYQYLALNPTAILQGQVWRLVTFLIQPPSTDFLYFLLYMYLYYLLGSTLERSWGCFVFNLYILIGILGHIVGAMAIYFLTGYNGAPYYYDLSYLYLSLFFGFAATFPDTQFLLFFIIPIKAKWLAIVDGLFFVMGLVNGTMSTRIMAIMSLANFLLFFFSMNRGRFRGAAGGAARKAAFTQKVNKAKINVGRSRHRCAVCGRTELDDDTLEFRFCSQCEGAFEYCSEHLFTHRHVKNQ